MAIRAPEPTSAAVWWALRQAPRRAGTLRPAGEDEPAAPSSAACWAPWWAQPLPAAPPTAPPRRPLHQDTMVHSLPAPIIRPLRPPPPGYYYAPAYYGPPPIRILLRARLSWVAPSLLVIAFPRSAHLGKPFASRGRLLLFGLRCLSRPQQIFHITVAAGHRAHHRGLNLPTGRRNKIACRR